MATDRKTKLDFYYDEINPQSRSCLILIKLMNVDVNLHDIGNEKLPESLEHIKLDSTCKVPTTSPFLIGHNFIVSDCTSILVFLCDYFKVEGPDFYPLNTDDRIEVVQKLLYARDMILKEHVNLMSDISKNTFVKSDFKSHTNKIISVYNAVEDFLRNCPFICKYLSIADMLYFSTISGLSIVFPINSLIWPNLYKWYNALQNSEIGKLNEPGLKVQCQILEDFGSFKSSFSIN